MPLLRRIAFAPVVLFVVAVVTYAVPRVLRPDLYPGEGLISGLARDMERVFLHLDFGKTTMLPGDHTVQELLFEGLIWDVWLLAGALVIGVLGGIAAGRWCARRPGSLRARALESGAMAAYCAPVFFSGLLLLWLFNSTYGRVPLPWFFDAAPNWAQPWSGPWDWFRALLVPWLVLGAPLGAMCLRLTLAVTREAMDEDFVRTAAAKGIPHKDIVRRHAAPLSYPGTFSFVGVSAPLIITNIVLVERVFSVPGYFRWAWRASGHAELDQDPYPYFEVLSAMALWAAVLLIVLGLLADAIVSVIDPHVRTSSAQAW